MKPSETPSQELKVQEPKPAKVMGRPPFQVTEEVIAKIESMAQLGLSQVQIAKALGITDDTLITKKKTISAISEAMERGRANGIHAVASALFRNATLPSKLHPYGNAAAQTFFLKSKGGFSESAAPEGQEVEEFTFRRTRPAR